MLVKKMFSRIFFLTLCLAVSFDSIFAEVELDWWQKSIFYQIYPRSFKDSNGDGVGDLKGIEEQISYFKETGIDAVWLSPIFKSPMYDAGYDISNFTEIDPVFGTMENFDSLMKTFKSMGIKVLLDFVPNHSSNECLWFQKSIKKIDPYTDFFVWKDPKEWINGTIPVPPNNWVSVFQESAWEYNEERKQYYLHQFLIQQPDLNYRSRALVEEMKSALRFWLDKGVDGFRVDSIMFLFEDAEFRDEPVISNSTINGYLAYTSLDHIHTLNLPETYDMLAEIRELLDSYKKRDGETRILMTEAYTTLQNTIRYYGNSTHPMAQIPFNFQLLTYLNFTSNAADFNSIISSWMDNMPPGQLANWVLGNHDHPRITSRFEPELIDGINMLLLLLPGVGIIYNGDEIGMLDTKIRWDQTSDVAAKKIGEALFATISRDPERTPFQWNSSTHAGFSNTTGNTWLPVNPNFYKVNYDAERAAPKSHWKLFRDLLNLRKNNVFLHGEFSTYTLTDWVFGFKRNTSDEIYIMLLNLNNEEEYVNLRAKISELPAPTLSTVWVSLNSEYKVGDKLTIGQLPNDNQNKNEHSSQKIGFPMRPNSAIVLQAPLKTGDSAEYHSGAYSTLCTSCTAILPITFFTMYFLNNFGLTSY